MKNSCVTWRMHVTLLVADPWRWHNVTYTHTDAIIQGHYAFVESCSVINLSALSVMQCCAVCCSKCIKRVVYSLVVGCERPTLGGETIQIYLSISISIRSCTCRYVCMFGSGDWSKTESLWEKILCYKKYYSFHWKNVFRFLRNPPNWETEFFRCLALWSVFSGICHIM